MMKTWIDSRVKDIAQAVRNTTDAVLMILKDNTSVLMLNVRSSMVLKVH